MAKRAADQMSAAAAILIVDRIVAVEDRDFVAVRCLQRPQPLLIGYSRLAIHIGPALKEAEHQRHPRLRLQLTMEEIAIAGMQQPFVFAAHGDAAMTERMTGQRNHQDIRLAIAERAHALKAEPVLAAFAVEFPVGSVLPLLGDIAAPGRRDLMRDRHLVFPAMDMHFCLREIRNSAGMIAIEMREQGAARHSANNRAP